MSEEQIFLLTPVLNLQEAWGGVWLHGNRESEDFTQQIQTAIPQLRIHVTGDIALATGIRSAEQLTTARNKGATAFAGPYISHPPIVAASKQDSGRVVLLRLLTLLTQDADTSEIEQIFKREPGLSFHLFRLVNSSGMGLIRQITTFNQAIMVLGRRQLQRWVQLLLYANKNESRDSPLLVFAAMRGCLLELLAFARGCDVSVREQAFMTGIFSLLDSLLGMSMNEISKCIQLPDPVRSALLDRQGELGELLAWVEEVQAGGEPSQLIGIEAEKCAHIQLDALCWALDVGAGMT